jgi:hypothetical protein
MKEGGNMENSVEEFEVILTEEINFETEFKIDC